ASADLVLLVGQHCMPTIGEFAFGPDAKYIRIDQAAEDIGRNIPIDLGIVSCEKAALEALADAVPRLTHDSWVAEIAAARKQYGAIGPDVAYAVGVSAAVQLGVGPQAPYKGHPIVCTTGDAGVGYSIMEIETLSKYRLPAVVIVYNNNAWGTWSGAAREPLAL